MPLPSAAYWVSSSWLRAVSKSSRLSTARKQTRPCAHEHKANERTQARMPVPQMSKVYLVGAGPGDPDLITWKGRKLLAIAASVLYDHLASEHLLELTRKNCERIYVGKKKAVRAFPQEEICAMMIETRGRGLMVVRLKGGDPFIFGRGGEELEALADAGIPFEVVPGVTSPLGIAAYSGVPLTHRAHTKLVTFVTGHDVHAID